MYHPKQVQSQGQQTIGSRTIAFSPHSKTNTRRRTMKRIKCRKRPRGGRTNRKTSKRVGYALPSRSRTRQPAIASLLACNIRKPAYEVVLGAGITERERVDIFVGVSDTQIVSAYFNDLVCVGVDGECEGLRCSFEVPSYLVACFYLAADFLTVDLCADSEDVECWDGDECVCCRGGGISS